MNKLVYYLKNPVLSLRILYYKFLQPFYILNLKLKGVKLKGKVKVRGKPMIDRREGKIIIDRNVLLNSSNFGYHAHLNPVKLFTDRKNAIIEIGSNSRIHGTTIHAWKKVTIGINVLIAGNTVIIDSNGHELCLDNPENRLATIDEPEEIIIHDNVWIGINSVILKGTIIGEGSIVSANSVVKGKFPPNSLIRGNPAVIVKINSSKKTFNP